MAADLVAALVEWADGQPSLTAIFPGGIYNSQVPTGDTTPLPYLTFVQSDGRILNLCVGGGTKAVQWPNVAIEVRATFAADARAYAGVVRDLLLVASPLSWTGGAESGRYEAEGEGGELEEGMGPDGSDVWVHRIPMVFCTARY